LDKNTADIIALTLIPGLGPRSIISLINKAGSVENIFSMSKSEISIIIKRNIDIVKEFNNVKLSQKYVDELLYIEKEKIRVISYTSSDYPKELKNIYDPPAVLYSKGEILESDINSVAIVGSRRCTAYGLQVAEKLAYDLAEKGVTVVSGMAKGIDSAVHKGVIKASGRTIAVMGSGFRHIYPAGSEKLMNSITEKGVVITEYDSDTNPSRMTFPRRNRIISGLVKGVIVVEAAVNSGAMITVNFALDQGKEIFAVPGRIDFNTSKGTNKLIQDGAKLVTKIEDVLEELDLEENMISCSDTYMSFSADDSLNEENSRVLNILREKSPLHIDEITGASGIKLNILPGILINLEVKGLIEETAGKNYMVSSNKR
jgi:DNA processing protein